MEQNIWVLKYRRFQEKYKKCMLAGILLHIIKLKTTYSHKSHHYAGCNQSQSRVNITYF